MNWFIDCIKNKYAQFEGRARRKEYWFFVLFYLIVYIVLSVIDTALGLLAGGVFGILSGIFWLATLIPAIAVAIRRLHDTDRSGWWVLLGLIPLVGLVLLVFFVLPGTAGDNRFGPDPLAGESAI